MSPPVAVDNDSNNVGSVAATGPLTVDAIPALRAKSAKVPTGVAPATNSDMFKSPVCYFFASINPAILCGERPTDPYCSLVQHCFTKPQSKRWDRKSSDCLYVGQSLIFRKIFSPSNPSPGRFVRLYTSLRYTSILKLFVRVQP